MSDMRGGQWCEGGEDSDVSDERMRWRGLQLIHIGILD